MHPHVRPADVSIAFGSESGLVGAHPRGLADVNPPLWAFRRAFIVDVLLLSIGGGLFPLFVCYWSINFKDLLV